MEKKKGYCFFSKINLMVLVNTFLISLFCIYLFTFSVNAVVGEDNVTVITLLDVGNVFPEVLNVSIQDDDATFSLTPNDTTTLTCLGRIRDYNGEGDIDTVRAEFYDLSVAALGDSDDNNNHYSNVSCETNSSGEWGGHSDDGYTLIANCTLDIEYYANPGEWNCTIVVNDTFGLEGDGNDSINISELLGIGLPDSINYGTVNATTVSDENVTNVTNYGNVMFNLSVEGYAQTEGDGYAMNCSLGSSGFIDVGFEKYNLTESISGSLTYEQFTGNYTNLTDDAVIGEYKLDYRQNDGSNEAYNQTYWRIYVPRGVAGSCTGNIIFGATKAVAS